MEKETPHDRIDRSMKKADELVRKTSPHGRVSFESYEKNLIIFDVSYERYRNLPRKLIVKDEKEKVASTKGINPITDKKSEFYGCFRTKMVN